MATEKRLIRYDGLKQEIIDFKKGLNPKNTDYATGYFSALSVVEGMMVQHIAEETVEVVHQVKYIESLNVQQWIPVSERLPEQGQEVIIYTGNILKPTVLAYQFWNPKYDTWAHVTHWMPLPEPPK